MTGAWKEIEGGRRWREWGRRREEERREFESFVK